MRYAFKQDATRMKNNGISDECSRDIGFQAVACSILTTSRADARCDHGTRDTLQATVRRGGHAVSSQDLFKPRAMAINFNFHAPPQSVEHPRFPS